VEHPFEYDVEAAQVKGQPYHQASRTTVENPYQQEVQTEGKGQPYLQPDATVTKHPSQVQTEVKGQPHIILGTTTTEPQVKTGVKGQPYNLPSQFDCTIEMKKPCQKIMAAIFSKGHAIILPGNYVESCEREICSSPQDVDSVNDVVCEWAAEYADACREAGVCQNWRDELGCPVQECPLHSHYEECGPGCDKKCEDDGCDEPIGPSCYCDDDMVMLNGKCQPKDRCITCTDKENNVKYVGEEWREGNCTTCTCAGEGSVACVTKTCERKTCDVGFILETSQGMSDTCCPHQVCVPATGQCQQLVEPSCGEYQEVKTVLGPDNCPRYVCECVSTCPALASTASPLLDGEEYETDNTGCCATIKKVCKKENCPAEIQCSKNLVKILDLSSKDSCCPKYKCDIPRDKCLYTMKNVDVGEVIAKKINETWSDGECKTCKCYARKPTKDCPDKPPESSCSVKSCDKRQMRKDKFKYVLEEIRIPGVCCSEYKKTACKKDGSIYQIGESWTGETDVCKKYSCVEKDGEAKLEYNKEKCVETCKKGSTYVPSTTECCGTCVPTDCVMDDGSLLSPGETKTENSGCSKISCKILDGKAVTLKESSACPVVPADCPEESIKLDQTGCCKICVSCKDYSNNTKQVGDTWTNGKWEMERGWVEDKCSKCTCQDDGSTSCTTTSCEKTVCEVGRVLEIVKGTEDECCPRYTCMPEALPLIKGAPAQQCPPITEPECGNFQEVKSITGPDNCPRYVCECVQICPIPRLAALKPGEEYVTSTAGCCPMPVKTCRKEKCPTQTNTCENYLEETLDQATKDDCCPQFVCELPKDKCVYTMKNEDVGTVSAKAVGESWSDGPCESCSCERSSVSKGGQPQSPESVCSVTKCDLSSQTRAEVSYVIDITTTPGECCATFSKTACKVEERGQQQIKQIGESWNSTADLCKTLSCVLKEGEAHIETTTTLCSQASACSPGSEYQPSTTECCGRCVATHCVMENGDLLAPGERKTDETGCKTTECKLISGKPSTIVESAVCPAIPSDCPPQFLVPDKTGCCQVCSRPEKLKNCAAIPVGDDTVGKVELYLPGHGPCKNVAPILDWTRCQGQCRSGSFFNSVEGRHVNNCSCCQPTTEREVIVPLMCSDGFTTSKTVSIPTGCDCLACVTEDAHDPRYQVEQFEQSHAALVQQDVQGQHDAQVSPEDIFGAPQAQAQLVPDVPKKTVAEVSAQDIFGSPQAQLAPEVPKEPIAEVSAQDIFGIPDSEVQLAPDRYQQRSNLVSEDHQHGEISVDDLFGLN